MVKIKANMLEATYNKERNVIYHCSLILVPNFLDCGLKNSTFPLTKVNSISSLLKSFKSLRSAAPALIFVTSGCIFLLLSLPY